MECRICGDQANGNNFGVISCESCKAFFRRNANKELICNFSDDCLVEKLTRKFCQKCRQRKCFQVGMKRELIKIETSRKRKHSNEKLQGKSRKTQSQQESENVRVQDPQPSSSSHPQVIKEDSSEYSVHCEATSSWDQNSVASSIGSPKPSPRPQTWDGTTANSVNNDNITPMLSRQVSPPNVTNPYVPRPDMSVSSKVEPGLVNSRLDNSVVTPEMPGLLSNGRFQHPQGATTTDNFESAAMRAGIALNKTFMFHDQSYPEPGPAEKLNYSGRPMHAEKEQQQDPLVGRVNAAQFLAPNKTIQDYQESVLSGRSLQPVCSTQAMKCPTTQAYPGMNPMNNGTGFQHNIKPTIPSTSSSSGSFPPSEQPCTSSQLFDICHNLSRKSDSNMFEFERTWSMKTIIEKAIDTEFIKDDGFQVVLNDREKARINELSIAARSLEEPFVATEEEIIESMRLEPSLVSVINLTNLAIKRIIKMAKQIASFSRLCQEDQVTLLKGGCLELMLLRSVCTYNPERNVWQLPGMRPKELSMNVLKQTCIYGINLYEEHQRFVTSFEPEFKNDETIMLLLSGIALFSDDRKNLIHKYVVKMEKDSYYFLLRRYLETKFPGCGATDAYLKLIGKLLHLRQLNESHLQLFMEMDPREIEPLLREIFDLNPAK